MKLNQLSLIIALNFLSLLNISIVDAQTSSSQNNSFSFIFMTDIHVQYQQKADEGLKKAIDLANSLNPDFVLTGGDLIMDALGQPFGYADSLYKLYVSTSKNFRMPVHNTIGNHEHFGIYRESGISPDHPDYGLKMFERYLGNSFYSFDHKGWHFMVLNSVATPGRRYIGEIDKEQLEWIKQDLVKVDPNTPIISSTHIPLISLYTSVFGGNMVVNDSASVVTNAQEVIKLFAGHNLRLVLQGHQHFYEDITYQFDNQTIRFITGGAVCARWWSGPERGLQEGFLKVDIDGPEIKTQYIDYKWEALPAKQE